jgi:hypothetical protein
MMEDDSSVLLEVLIKPQTRCRTREHLGEQCFAHGERIAPQIITVQPDQIEGVQENAIIVVSISDALEVRDSVVAARDRLPSMMQDRDRSLAMASTMSGKR